MLMTSNSAERWHVKYCVISKAPRQLFCSCLVMTHQWTMHHSLETFLTFPLLCCTTDGWEAVCTDTYSGQFINPQKKQLGLSPLRLWMSFHLFLSSLRAKIKGGEFERALDFYTLCFQVYIVLNFALCWSQLHSHKGISKINLSFSLHAQNRILIWERE